MKLRISAPNKWLDAVWEARELISFIAVKQTDLFKYSKYYSGQIPEFIEGHIFRIIVPLDEKYSLAVLLFYLFMVNHGARGCLWVNPL